MTPVPGSLSHLARGVAGGLRRLASRVVAADSRSLLVPMAGACLAGVGLIYLGGRRIRVEYEPHTGRMGDYR